MNPATLEAERMAVASALVDPLGADRVCEILHSGDFADSKLATLFASIHALVSARQPCGPPEVIASVAKHGIEAEFVLDLAQGTVASSSHARGYARVVLEASNLRRLGRMGLEVAKTVADATPVDGTTASVAEDIRIEIDGVLSRFAGRGPIALSAADPELLPRILENEPTPRGAMTGYYDLDDLLGGLRNSEMIVLAARPSVGKSLFACNVAENLAIHDDPTPVLVISCEMSAGALYRRALFGRAGVHPETALNGNTSNEEKEALRIAHAEIRRAKIDVIADGKMTAQRVHAAARRFKALHGRCLVIVDYLQLLHGEARSIYERVTDLSKAMKGVAVDVDVPMLVLSQLSRNAAETREKDGGLTIKRPTLSDLRDSGAIEQDADVVIFLSRDITKRDVHPCEVDVAKNRSGSTGHTQILFDPRGPRFRNLQRVEKWDGKS